MKKTFALTIGLVISILPILVSAQGMMNFSDAKTPYGMMQYVGEKSLGTANYEEANNLMVKMMTGKLTQAEADKLVTIMNQYPGAIGVMMGSYGMMSGYYPQNYNGQNWGMPHMGWNNYGGSSGIWSWMGGLTHLVWLLISILILVWLWQKVTKNK